MKVSLTLLAKLEKDGRYHYSSSLSQNPFNTRPDGIQTEMDFENEALFRHRIGAGLGNHGVVNNVLSLLHDYGRWNVHVQMSNEQAAQFGWVS